MNTEVKYELIKKRNTDTLFTIKALRDFQLIDGTWVKAGDLGGMVSSQYNLHHLGSCWIGKGCTVEDGANVAGSALLQGRVSMHDNATVSGNVKLLGRIIVKGEADITSNAIVENHYSKSLVIIEDQVSISNDVVIRGSNIWLGGGVNLSDWVTIGSNTRLNGLIELAGTVHMQNVRLTGEWALDQDQCVKKKEDILIFDSVGSTNGTLVAARRALPTKDYIKRKNMKAEGDLFITRGCFTGTIAEFREAVDERHCVVDHLNEPYASKVNKKSAKINKNYMGIANIIAHWFDLPHLIKP